MKNSQALANVQDVICPEMSKILDEVRQKVRSLPMREMKQSVLDEKVHNLAAAGFVDPGQHLLQTHYAWEANGRLLLILKENDKIIAEVNFNFFIMFALQVDCY